MTLLYDLASERDRRDADKKFPNFDLEELTVLMRQISNETLQKEFKRALKDVIHTERFCEDLKKKCSEGIVFSLEICKVNR